jgi:predicted  nucleic acid-binding Zn-ribbon protein
MKAQGVAIPAKVVVDEHVMTYTAPQYSGSKGTLLVTNRLFAPSIPASASSEKFQVEAALEKVLVMKLDIEGGIDGSESKLAELIELAAAAKEKMDAAKDDETRQALRVQWLSNQKESEEVAESIAHRKAELVTLDSQFADLDKRVKELTIEIPKFTLAEEVFEI